MNILQKLARAKYAADEMPMEVPQGMPQDAQPTPQDIMIQLLIKAYCDELTAEWQYFTAVHTARGMGRVDALAEYEQHESDEKDHRSKIADRIEQLGGPIITDLASASQMGNPWQPVETPDVKAQLAILIQAERNAMAFYQQIVDYATEIGDWVTQKLFKDLLESETEHDFDLSRLIEEL